MGSPRPAPPVARDREEQPGEALEDAFPVRCGLTSLSRRTTNQRRNACPALRTSTAVIRPATQLRQPQFPAGPTGAPGASPTTSSSTSPSQPSNGSPAPTQRPAPRPHIDGTVASVSGDTVTVTDHDGFTRTIVTSTATTYAGGLSAPLAVGTEIHTTGTVDANHTSLDATQIGTRPTPPAGARGKDGPRPPMPPAEGGPGPGQDGQQHAGPVRPVAPAAPGGSTPAPSTTGGS